MRRAVVCTTLALLTSTIAAVAPPQKPARRRSDDVVSMRGCVSGSLLKSVRADLARAWARSRPASATG